MPPTHSPHDEFSPVSSRPGSRAGQPAVRSYHYQLIDVFTDKPFSGSPLAVFTDARGLNTESMQRIARELNHAETSFVFPPFDEAHDFSVRIFSPTAELPTTGHPTIGTAFTLNYEARASMPAPPQRMVFEELSGPVSVSLASPITTTRQELPRFGATYGEPNTAAAVLSLTSGDLVPGLPVQAVASRLPYLIVPVRNLAALERIRLRVDIWERTVRQFEAPHLCAFSLESRDETSTATLRTFAPALGIREAPASESACGPLTAYLVRHKLMPEHREQSLIFDQGESIGRPSVLHVTAEQVDGELTRLRIGGQCVVVGEGTIFV